METDFGVLFVKEKIVLEGKQAVEESFRAYVGIILA
jgi:hypothetical protein